MSRRSIAITLAGVAVLAAVGFGLYAKSASAVTPGVIAISGDVRVDESVVKAPAVVYPTPDYTVGIPSTSTASAKKRTATSASGSTSRLPVVSGFLARVLVAQGSHVSTGDVVARLDTTMLDLGVEQAQTARTKARADLSVLDHTVDKLDTTRAKLIKTRSTIISTRASLETTYTALKKKAAALTKQIATIKALIGMPGGPPPSNPPLPVVLQQLEQGLAGLKTGIGAVKTGLGTIDQGLIKLNKGIAQIDSAHRQLRDARKLAVINIDAQNVAVSLARARRDAARIVSPISGTVTYARAAGTAVMVGAPIVRIRPDGRSHVTGYLTADQLAQVRVGSRASVRFDSNPGAALTGRVSAFGSSAVVPPTSFPTSIVHMTRAVGVTIELDDGLTAPPGTPVDIEIITAR